jgi:hypothetical protein
MTNILDLFRGVGVMIDDDLKPEKEVVADAIWSIKKSFEDKNIPILTYYELPDEKVKNFNSVSFLLLDWDLIGLGEGIDLPQAAINDNTAFIKQFNEICFAPVFIFSNEPVEAIKSALVQARLYDDSKNNNIFIKSKSELRDVDLFTAIEEWIKETSSVYVLKEWELSLRQAKNSLFWDFYNINPAWAKILHKTINSDGGDLSYEMNEILFENLKTRILPITFNTGILSSTDGQPQIVADEMKPVLEGQRFRNHHLDMIFTGDIFLRDNKYYINVRPQCDCIPRGEGQTLDNTKLYLIEGQEVLISDKNKLKYSSKTGSFNDTDLEFTVFPICNNKAIRFNFKQLTMPEFQYWKQYRTGTLLSPFITRLIQKFASSMQRQGLPRIPEEAVR